MKKSFFLFVIVFVVSCSSKTFSNKEDLWQYLRDEDHGYLQTKKVNGYKFSVLYKPTDLLVEQELDSSTAPEKIMQLRDKYKKYLYITLSISKNNKELLSVTPKNRQEFGTMVNELAFGMGNKVYLYTPKKDTLDMLDYNYPRMYGMSKSTTMLFVYPREKKYLAEDYLNFTIGDLGTYTGEVRFKIDTEKIVNEPKLLLKK